MCYIFGETYNNQGVIILYTPNSHGEISTRWSRASAFGPPGLSFGQPMLCGSGARPALEIYFMAMFHGIYIYNVRPPRYLSWFITPITVVYGTYNYYSYWGL